MSGCNLLIHHACQAELENGGPGRETGGCNKFCAGHHSAAKLLAVPESHVAGATIESSMNSISNEIQQGLTSKRVGSILPPGFFRRGINGSESDSVNSMLFLTSLMA